MQSTGKGSAWIREWREWMGGTINSCRLAVKNYSKEGAKSSKRKKYGIEKKKDADKLIDNQDCSDI
jgi:hypothetical protein